MSQITTKEVYKRLVELEAKIDATAEVDRSTKRYFTRLVAIIITVEIVGFSVLYFLK